MIWEATFGNGVRIGGTVIRPGVFCGAVLGTSIQAPCVQLTATTPILRIPSAATGFVVCQDRINYPWPHEVRSLQATKERPLLLSISYKDGTQALQNRATPHLG